MIYLELFYFPSDDTETDFLYLGKYNPRVKMTCFNTSYPFNIFPLKGLEALRFKMPITLLYGTNGNGKSTALNVIAEKLHLSRDALYNKAPFMDDFITLCGYNPSDDIYGIPRNSRIIASDDVFNFMINLRSVN